MIGQENGAVKSEGHVSTTGLLHFVEPAVLAQVLGNPPAGDLVTEWRPVTMIAIQLPIGKLVPIGDQTWREMKARDPEVVSNPYECRIDLLMLSSLGQATMRRPLPSGL